MLNAIAPIDSILVVREYKKQALGEKLLKPKRVVFSEIRVFDLLVARQVLGRLNQGELFDSLLIEFGGSIKGPLGITKNSPLSLSLFKKKPTEVSEIIKNKDGSFSVARVERFLMEEVFDLDLVYKKLERGLLSSSQDSIKNSLLEILIKDLKPKINWSVLGL